MAAMVAGTMVAGTMQEQWLVAGEMVSAAKASPGSQQTDSDPLSSPQAAANSSPQPSQAAAP